MSLIFLLKGENLKPQFLEHSALYVSN